MTTTSVSPTTTTRCSSRWFRVSVTLLIGLACFRLFQQDLNSPALMEVEHQSDSHENTRRTEAVDDSGDVDRMSMDTEQKLLEQAEEELREEEDSDEQTQLTAPPSTPSLPSPAPFNFTHTQGVGACLLIKDDNHWAVEWLAYHWFVMPLRHLVVVIDPNSQTSPRGILARWKGLMEIEIWNETDFLPPISARTRALYQNNTQLMLHRHRQASFYQQCLQHMKQRQMPWVYLTDTDEFTSLNYRGIQETGNSDLQEMAQQFPIELPGSVLRFLMHHRQVSGTVQKCLYIQRYLVGSNESDTSLVERYLPSNSTSLQASNFLTQRFLVQTPRYTSYGKNMVHVTAVRSLKPNPNVHKVSLHCPSKEAAVRLESTSFLKIQHYIGTPDQYSFRSDPRAVAKRGYIRPGQGSANYDERNLERYHALGQDATHLDTYSQGWIDGFIQQVGIAKAQELLAGVGQVGVE